MHTSRWDAWLLIQSCRTKAVTACLCKFPKCSSNNTEFFPAEAAGQCSLAQVSPNQLGINTPGLPSTVDVCKCEHAVPTPPTPSPPAPAPLIGTCVGPTTCSCEVLIYVTTYPALRMKFSPRTLTCTTALQAARLCSAARNVDRQDESAWHDVWSFSLI